MLRLPRARRIRRGDNAEQAQGDPFSEHNVEGLLSGKVEQEPFDTADIGEGQLPWRWSQWDRSASAPSRDESSDVVDETSKCFLDCMPDWMVASLELGSEGDHDAGHIAAAVDGVASRELDQRFDRVGVIGEQMTQLVVPALFDPFHHRQRQFFLVGELVIERAPRVSGLVRQLLQHEVGIPVPGNTLRRGLQQGGSSACSAIGL